MKALIITGGGYHPFAETTPKLVSLLEARRGAETRVAEGAAGLTDENLAWADMVVVNHQGGELSDDRGEALEAFVKRGGALVGFHSAADSFRNSERYLNLIGCEFVTHDAPAPVRIHLADAGHQITAHVDDEFVVHDEIYQCKIHGDPTILATANWKNTSYPMIAINNVGKGRVYYLALGHYAELFDQYEFETLLMRGIDWAVNGPIKKPLGVGLLGVGPSYAMGQLHAGFIDQAFGLEVKAACDLKQECLDAIKEKYPDIATYQNVDDMLADDAVQMVTTIVPHHVHAELGIKVLDAGRHLVMEKPFTLTTKEATGLIDLAAKNDCMVSCFQNRHWDPDAMVLVEIIRSGKIGKVFQVAINIGGATLPQEVWRADKAVSGGLLFDWAAHHFDWILQFIEGEVKSAFAVSQKVRWHNVTNEDNVKIMFRFDNDVIAEYHASTVNTAGNPRYVTVLGSEGAATIEGVGPDRYVRVVRVSPAGETVSEEKISLFTPYTKYWPRYYRNVADHLHFGEPLVITADWSRRVISMIEAAYASAQSGQAVTPAFG